VAALWLKIEQQCVELKENRHLKTNDAQ